MPSRRCPIDDDVDRCAVGQGDGVHEPVDEVEDSGRRCMCDADDSVGALDHLSAHLVARCVRNLFEGGAHFGDDVWSSARER